MKLKTLGLILVMLALTGCVAEAPAPAPTADPEDSEAPLGDLDALLADAPDQSKLPDEPDLSTFNPIALEKSQVDIVKNISVNYSALLGTGVFPLLDKLNALALKLPNQREPVVMKEEKVFGEESAYTFNHEALSIDKVIQLLEDYGFITTVYEGFQGI